MPLRGESVGTAYVRIIADGTGLPQSIRDEFDKAGGPMKDAGSKSAKDYKKGFEEGLASHEGRSLDDALVKALVADDLSGPFFESDQWKRFEHNIQARFGDQGKKAAEQMKEEFLKSGGTRAIEKDVEGVVERINRNVEEEVKRTAAEQKKAMNDFENNFRRVMNETDRLFDKTRRDATANLSGLERSLNRAKGAFFTYGENAQKASEKVNRGSRDVDKDRHIFIRMAKTFDSLGDSIGHAMGKGSRNDLLNFFGSFVSGSIKVIGLIPRILGGIAEFPAAFKTALDSGKKFFPAIAAGFAGMGTEAAGAEAAVGELAATGPVGLLAIAAAAAAAIIVLGPIAALVSGITAALTAMIASLSFAVVGLLAPLVGLIAPLAIGLGVVAAGFASLGKEGRKNLATFLQSITVLKQLAGVAKTAFVNTLFDTTGAGIQGGRFKNSTLEAMKKSLLELKPLFRSVGRGLGDLTQEIFAGFKSPEFSHFVDVMANVIPHMFRKLGNIIRNVGGILGSIFIATVPAAQSFLNWLQKITGEFDNWLKTKEGRKEVKHFLDEAATSAHALGDFLGAVSRLLGTILEGGKGSGDNIISSLADSADRFNEFLKKNPGAIKEFFKNGEQVAHDIGVIAINIGKVFDALDSPGSRQFLHGTLSVIQHLIAATAKVAGPVETAILGIGAVIGVIGHVMHRASDALSTVTGWIRRINRVLSPNPHFQIDVGGAIRAVNRLSTAVDSAIRHILSNVGRVFGQVASTIGNAMQRAAQNAATAINSIPGRIGGVAAAFGHAAASWFAAVMRELGRLPGQIVGLFTGLASRIVSAIGSINLFPHINWPSPPGWLSKITASGGVFSGAQARIIGEAGPEAVVPLNRPLSMVDPSVRWLSAIAQGMSPGGSGSVTQGGKTVNATINVHTPTTDVRAVARETVNHLVAAGY